MEKLITLKMGFEKRFVEQNYLYKMSKQSQVTAKKVKFGLKRINRLTIRLKTRYSESTAVYLTSIQD